MVGRWNVIDRYAEKYSSTSVYDYVSNNPIKNIDMNGDTILTKINYNFNLTSNPVVKSDLGSTDPAGVSVKLGSNYANIAIGFTLSFSGAFIGTTPGPNIEAQNPGLFANIKGHEEGHVEQNLDAAKNPIAISVNIDGIQQNFSGQGDNVIQNALSAFSGSNTATTMSQQDKSIFINNNIITPAATAVYSNVIQAPRNPANSEADANSRAAAKLGPGVDVYNNESRRIRFNGRIIN